MNKLVIAATLAASTAALVGLPSVAAAGPDTDSVSTATPIQHLVVVFQENASFDHYFGTYPQAANPPGEPVFTPRIDTPVVNNLLPSQFNGNIDLRVTNGNLSRPFRLDRSQFVTCSQDHSYKPEQRAANLSRMDRFVQQTDKSGCKGLPQPVPSPQVMGYFDGNTVTALWNYAQHYALNDYSFATTYGPSTPGALNLVAGRTSGASPDITDRVLHGTMYGDAEPAYDDCSDGADATMTGPNVGDLLNQAGVTWGWFQGGFARTIPLTDPVAACNAGASDSADPHLNRNGVAQPDYEAHHDPFQYFLSTANPHHLPPTSVDSIGHDDQANHQYDLTDFWAAADDGHLPAVSFLKAPAFQDGHPGPNNSNPLDEQDFLVQTLNHLQGLPEWSTTAVVLAWDDSDGGYDHQFPPNVHHSRNVTLDTLYGAGSDASPNRLMCMAAPGQPAPPESTVFDLRCGYGERLPLLVISPFARENHVDHTITDQTSVLGLIEYNWGLPQLGNASFDFDTGSLLPMFDFGHQRDDRLVLNPLTGNPNTPPVIDGPTLTPTEPVTDDVLIASASSHDVDHDVTNGSCDPPVHLCDVVTLRYQWFNGTTPLAETSNRLDLSAPGNGDHGDTITVQVTASDGIDTTTAMASAVIADSAPSVQLDADSATVDYSDHLQPIAVTTADADGDPVTVEGIGLPDGIEVARDDSGSYVVTGVADAPAGAYDAVIRASDGALTTDTPLHIIVRREGVTVGYTGDLLFPTSGTNTSTAPVRLQAQVNQDDDGSPGDLTRAAVVFDLYASTNLSTTPDASYRASAASDGVVRVDIASLPLDTWTVVVHSDPAGRYFAATTSDASVLTVYAPTTDGSVTGGGWVHDPGYLDRPVAIAPDDDHGDLGVSVKLKKSGAPAGHAVYVFSGADGNDYLIRSTSWQGGGLAISGNRAVIAGKCVVTVIDASGSIVSQSGNYSFRVDAVDHSKAGEPDSYALSVFTPGGVLYHLVGTPAQPLPLSGGNLVVHD
jgi:phospholipase C